MTYLFWLVLILGLAASPHISAQTDTESSVPTQLPAVEVRGQYLGAKQRIRDSTMFATVVDVSESTAQVDSIADVLSESVGVQVRRFGGLGAFSTVSIRGSTPSQVGVYLNGVRLNQANVGLVDLGDIPLDNVERIEIYRGFSPLQLGAGSIGGSINLVTRQVVGETVNRVSSSYGSYDTRKFTLYRSQAFTNLGYVVLFNYTGSEGDFEFFDDNGTPFNPFDDEVTKRQNNDFQSFNINAKGEMTVAGWNITLLDDFFTKDQGVPGRSSNQSETASLEVRRNVATLRFERRGFPWTTTDAAFQLAHTWQREDFQDRQDEIGIGAQDEENTSHVFSANGLLNFYGDFHAGQVHDHLLEVHARFQPALADLGLIGGIRGIPAGVFQDIAEDDAGHLGAVIAHADHRDENPVPFRQAPQVRQSAAFGLVGADVEGFVIDDAFGHHRFDQLVERLQAEEFEHFGDLFFTGTDMAADEVVTLFQVAQGLSGH